MNSKLNRVLVVTGSGISAESGIPTFRGKGGYWRNLDPTKLATETAFLQNPELVWQWYRERRDLIRRSDPNAAHHALVRLAAHCQDFLLLTQNVDDLHARAAWEGRRLSPAQMVQIHGNIFVTHCSRCDFRMMERDGDANGVPLCPRCGAKLRPGVIWFNEELDPHEVRRVDGFLDQGPCDLVLVIGTTAVFEYIINWATAGKGDNGRLIEINPEVTPISPFATERHALGAARILPELVNRFSA